jgi:hypothetical protein
MKRSTSGGTRSEHETREPCGCVWTSVPSARPLRTCDAHLEVKTVAWALRSATPAGG